MDTNIFRSNQSWPSPRKLRWNWPWLAPRTDHFGPLGQCLKGRLPEKPWFFRVLTIRFGICLQFWGVSNSPLLPVILNHSETLGDLPHRPNRLWLMVCFHPGQCDVFLETILEGAGPFNPILMLNTPTSGFPK